jgi:CRP-like cAMP-binding protein
MFAGLDEDALRLLIQRARKKCFEPGAVILREGEPGSEFYLVTSGLVSVVKQGPHGKVELAKLGVGETFGEMCILDRQPRTATIVANKVTELLCLPASVFRDLWEEAPVQFGVLILNIARDLSRRLRRIDDAFAATH